MYTTSSDLSLTTPHSLPHAERRSRRLVGSGGNVLGEPAGEGAAVGHSVADRVAFVSPASSEVAFAATSVEFVVEGELVGAIVVARDVTLSTSDAVEFTIEGASVGAVVVGSPVARAVKFSPAGVVELTMIEGALVGAVVVGNPVTKVVKFSPSGPGHGEVSLASSGGVSVAVGASVGGAVVASAI